MAEGGQAPDMGDLLAYFEEHSRRLDAEGQPVLDASTLQFISLIRFDGVPILPPVLTQTRRSEMQNFKREALRRQNQNRAKKREELHAKVQSIVAGVEERRAARQASKTFSPASKSGRKQSSKMETVSKITTKSALPEGSSKAPPEIIINVSASQAVSEATPSSNTAKSAVKAAAPSPKTARKSTTKQSPAPSKEASPKKTPERMGMLSKQKSFSTQHLDRSPSRLGRDSRESPGSAKSLSPNSGGLLPHPPQGRPQRRTSPLWQSSSTPDLRTLDFTGDTDTLRSSITSKSLAVRGGRPQTPDRDSEQSTVKKENKKVESHTKTDPKLKHVKAKLDTNRKEIVNVKDRNNKKLDKVKGKETENVSPISKTSKGKVSTQGLNIPNPLEALEQEISKEAEAEKSMTVDKSKTNPADLEIRSELLDPIQSAAAELFPFPISEEQALATLDSLQSDFASMEQAESLPGDYNGIPLTSQKQKQIIHMLTKLSRALNIEDTLASTTSSIAGGETKESCLDIDRGQTSQHTVSDNRSGASRKGRSISESSDTVEGAGDDSITNESNTTGQSSMQNTSASSQHSRARMSPTGSSSILSSASSVSASRARMSPKSLRNTTVHFSSVVTEISTSASQSYEDKISYRKMDITPKSSENFDGESGEEAAGGGDARRDVPNSLLSKVNLSPSVDSSAGSPGEILNPFETSSQDGELNTSDKENEFVAPVTRSEDSYRGDNPSRPSSRNQHVLNVYRANIPEGPIGPNHPAVIKASLKSDQADTDSIKLEHYKYVPPEQLSKLQLTADGNYPYSDISRFIEESKGINSSTSSFQEEITKSYLQTNPDKFKLLHIDDNNVDELGTDRTGTFEQQLDDLHSAYILLTPVADPSIQKSLEHNRTMLDDEAKIRSNLERVYLEDESDSDNNDSESDSPDVVELTEISDNNNVKEDDTEDENEIQDEIKSEDENSEADNERESDDDSDNNEEVENEQQEITDNKQHWFDVRPTSNEVGPTSNKRCLITEGKEEEIRENDMDIDTEKDNHDDDVKVKPVPEIDLDLPVPANNIEVVEVEEEEEEGKAEHIQKYLNQVHEQSMHQEENYEDEETEERMSGGRRDPDVMSNISDVIQSFTSTLQSMNHLSQEELFRIQAEQFEALQKRLVEQQQSQLEELFVSQRREQMKLQEEIESYHQRLSGQDSLETIQLKDALQPQPSASVPQVAQAWQQPQQSVAMTPPFPVQPVASAGPYCNNMNASGMSYNTSYNTVPYPIPTSASRPGYQYPQLGPQHLHGPQYMAPYQNLPPGMMGFAPGYGHSTGGVARFPGPGQDLDISHISHNTSYSTLPSNQEPAPTHPGIFLQKHNNITQNTDPNRTTYQGVNGDNNPFIYPPSPSLYRNPKDGDNASDVSGFARTGPKQLVFSNQSTPVAAKTFKPVMHSPQKQVHAQQNPGQVTLPLEINDPWMQHKFDKVSAAVKGYLTRRLLKTDKVQAIIKTIDDTRNFAFSFQAETPIKNGTFTREDRGLLERIVAQLQAALLDIHEIFFNIPVSERMNIIEASRQSEEYRRMRESSFRKGRESVSKSQPKISKATLKAMERKKKALLAEESVFGSAEFRPKSAPPTTSSPHLSKDLSGPLRRHYHSLFVRALRPIQGQLHMSPIQGDNQITVREMKERPKTARDKTKIGATTNKPKKNSSGNKTARSSSSATTTTTTKQKSAANKPKKTERKIAEKERKSTTSSEKDRRSTEKAWR